MYDLLWGTSNGLIIILKIESREVVQVGQDRPRDDLEMSTVMARREANSRTYICRLPENVLVAIIIDATISTIESNVRRTGTYMPNIDWPYRRLANHLVYSQLDSYGLEDLADVCHHLRQIVLGTSHLWADICESPPGHLGTQEQRFLRLSGSAPLRVRLCGTTIFSIEPEGVWRSDCFKRTASYRTPVDQGP